MNRFSPGELVLAEDEDLASQFGDDLALVLGATVLEHVLDHVVTVLVLHEDVPSASEAPPVRVGDSLLLMMKTNAKEPPLPDGFTDNQI